jgi:hypothetical protein
MRFKKKNWNGSFYIQDQSLNQLLSNLDAKLNYDFNDEIQFTFRYQNVNKLPNSNYNLHQSSYVQLHWSNDSRMKR